MKVLLLFFGLLPVLAAAQPDSGRLVINGSFADLPDSVLVTFNHPSSGTPLAQAYSKNKKFTLSTPVSFAGLSRINMSGRGVNSGLDIFTGAGNVTVTGKLAQVKNVQVKGAAAHNVFKNFIKVFDPAFKRLNDINGRMNITQDGGQRQKLMTDFEAEKGNVSNKVDSFIRKNQSSAVSSFLVFVVKDLFNATPVLLNNYLELLKGPAESSIYAGAVKKEVEAQMFGAVGTPAMDFTQNDTAGNPVKLSSFRGKYVLLDFWASWCGPCRMENPNVVTAFHKFKNKNFTVLGVSLDRPGKRDDWLQAIKDDNLTWTNVSDLKFWGNEVAQLYKVSGIPQNYLIDPKGNIIGKNLRGAALEAKLCEVLGCN